jgi:murein L,D-transpeptidase YcbB/YkuD
MINEMYAMQQEQMMAQAQAEYDRAIAELEHGRAQIPGYYQSAARTAAGQNAVERRAMNEQFAAMGLNTGTHGQAALSHSIAGQNQQAAIRQAEADALAEIEFARAQMMAEYQAAVRDAILSNNIAKAEALYNEALRLDQAAVQNAMNQAQLDYQARMEELAMLEARAEMLASIGDFSGYAALGYSAEEIAALEAAWQRENAPTGGGYTGGGQTYSYDTHGMSDAEIRALQAAAGITVDGIWGPDTEAAYQAMQAGLGTPTPSEPEQPQPVQPQSNPLASSHSQILYGAIANGTLSFDQIKLLLESYYGNGWISEAEADYLLSIMGY